MSIDQKGRTAEQGFLCRATDTGHHHRRGRSVLSRSCAQQSSGCFYRWDVRFSQTNGSHSVKSSPSTFLDKCSSACVSYAIAEFYTKRVNIASVAINARKKHMCSRPHHISRPPGSGIPWCCYGAAMTLLAKPGSIFQHVPVGGVGSQSYTFFKRSEPIGV